MEGTSSIEKPESIDLLIHFRGENGKIQFEGPYTFKEDALRGLIRDFESYCGVPDPKGSTTIKKGGWYRCKNGNQHKMLFLKFEEIVYIG